jgi:hypothetical protein
MVKNSNEQHQGKAPTPASWRPGQSGNPKGRPRKGSALTDAIRAKVDPTELIEIALKLARDGEAESTRLQALAWLRDSGYLKPAERHEHGVAGTFDEDDDEDLSLYTVEQLEQLAAAAHEFERRRGEIRDAVLVEIEPLALPQASVALDGVSTTNR